MLNVTNGINEEFMNCIIVGLHLAHLSLRQDDPDTDVVYQANFWIYARTANYIYEELRQKGHIDESANNV